MTESVFVVGTAGSGKSTFVSAFAKWMGLISGDCIIVNLDPGAEYLPYEPDVDIREWIKIKDIMEEHSLGPNGAQILAADMIALNLDVVRDAVEPQGGDVVLYDTPGQIELFAFRESSERTLRALSDDPVLAFLFDPVISQTPQGFTSLLMLASTIHFRFQVPFVPVLAKVDILDEEERERILLWSKEKDALAFALTSMTGMDGQMASELLKCLENLDAYQAVIPCSSEALLGMEDIYTAMRMAYHAGEDIEPPRDDG
jgi:GTPase SAR1 family protein